MTQTRNAMAATEIAPASAKERMIARPASTMMTGDPVARGATDWTDATNRRIADGSRTSSLGKHFDTDRTVRGPIPPTQGRRYVFRSNGLRLKGLFQQEKAVRQGAQQVPFQRCQRFRRGLKTVQRGGKRRKFGRSRRQKGQPKPFQRLEARRAIGRRQPLTAQRGQDEKSGVFKNRELFFLPGGQKPVSGDHGPDRFQLFEPARHRPRLRFRPGQHVDRIGPARRFVHQIEQRADRFGVGDRAD